MDTMSNLDRLAACAGRWHGSNRLHDPNTGAPEDSPATAVLTPLLGGRFIRLDYTWSYQGAAKEGSLLIGYKSDRGRVTAHWIDSWHMSEDVMACTGAVDDSGGIDVRGSYAAPPWPGLGLAHRARSERRGELRLVMHNVTPDGQEALAVEATYARTRDSASAASA